MRRQNCSKVEADDGAATTEKTRKCLMCKDEFLSEWSGERICTRCKRSNAWRQSMPSQHSSRPGGHR